MRARLARLVACGTIALASSTAGDALAAPPDPNGPDWAFGDPIGEIGVGAFALLSLTTYFIPQKVTAWAPSFPRPRDDIYGTLSDFTGAFIGSLLQLAGGYAMEAAYYDENSARLPLERSFRTGLVDLESLILTNGITGVFKRFTGSCRPRAWKEGKCGPEQAENDAFPSGHTAPVSAIAGSRLVLAIRSTGQVSTRWAAFGFAEGAAVITAGLRVLSGAHSWEDVLGGWAMGHATGSIVNLVHPMVDVETKPRATPEEPPASAPTVFTWSSAF